METGWLHFKLAIDLVQGHVLECRNVWYCFKGYSLIGLNFQPQVLVNNCHAMPVKMN